MLFFPIIFLQYLTLFERLILLVFLKGFFLVTAHMTLINLNLFIASLDNAK